MTSAKFAEGCESGDVDIVVYDSVWLLYDNDAGVWAREAPEHHSRCPEGTAVVDFER